MESQHNSTSGTVPVRTRIDMEFWSNLDPEVADLDADSHVGQAVCGLLVHLQRVVDTQAELSLTMSTCSSRLEYASPVSGCSVDSRIRSITPPSTPGNFTEGDSGFEDDHI